MSKRYHRRLRILLGVVLFFFFLMFHAFFKFERTFLSMELNQKQQELERTAKIKAESVQEKYDRFPTGAGCADP